MGQGLYTMIALGTTDIPERPSAVSEDDWYGWKDALSAATDNRMRGQYEAKPDYLAIPLAVSDGWLQERWNVPLELSDCVVPVATLVEFVADHLDEANRLWRQAQAAARAAGRELPPPHLLLISDYD